MSEILQNTLYLTTPRSFVARDHLTLQIEVPVYPPDLPQEDRTHDNIMEKRKLSIPIHHLESICLFGASTITAPALSLCWEHGVAVNYLTENGYLQARMTGVADTSVVLRRAQFRAADDVMKSAAIARHIIAGKMQNSRNSLLRAARESKSPDEQQRLQSAVDALARHLRLLESTPHASAGSGSRSRHPLDPIRGVEGTASESYFSVFSLLLKQQREEFAYENRSRRPPRDRINCLISFLYALIRHDCIAALTAIGLDPFVGFLHVDRPNRPSLALDLMEEFRPWLTDRLAVTLINRQQIGTEHFRERGATRLRKQKLLILGEIGTEHFRERGATTKKESRNGMQIGTEHFRERGAVEFTDKGRKLVIQAYQERKRETVTHPLLHQQLRIGQLPFVQARILARHLRGDIANYIPFMPK